MIILHQKKLFLKLPLQHVLSPYHIHRALNESDHNFVLITALKNDNVNTNFVKIVELKILISSFYMLSFFFSHRILYVCYNCMCI